MHQPCCPPAADRISLLPDDVLHAILSFLPGGTVDMVRTSVLSKRFRHLWAHHPCICLGLGSQVDDLLSRINPHTDPAHFPTVARYRHSVERCLSLHRSPVLRSLRLRLFSYRSAHRWIRFAARRSVAELRLSAHPDLYFTLPPTIFSCKSLTSLHLSSIAFPRVDDPTGLFPRLAHLKLTGRCIDHHETLPSLLSVCGPSLRTLSLTYCTGLESIHLSSTSLTVLEILECHFHHLVRIDAPNLTSLNFQGNVNNLFLQNVPGLLDASVFHWGEDLKTPSQWVRLMVELSQVSRKLKVNGWFFKFLLPESINPPLFTNLRVMHCYVWITPPVLDGLASVLGHCLNLEQLHIDMDMSFRSFHDVIQEEFDKGVYVWDPSKLMKETRDATLNLKIITLKSFLGTQNQMKLLEYLLGRASVLEKLNIGDCMIQDKKEIHQLLSFHQLLSYMPRASSHVQISCTQHDILKL